MPSSRLAARPAPSKDLVMDDSELVETLCEIDSGLSAWEIEFVESLAKWVQDEGRSLTENQRTKALEILEAKERNER